MICLSWYGGEESQDLVARQVAAVHRSNDSGLWLCVEKQGHAPSSTQLVKLKLDQKAELNSSLLFFEDCLMPLLSHLRTSFSFNREHYQAYRRWNRGLAEGIASLIRDGDVLWLHDAHWIPLAKYLKAIKPDLPIGLSFSSSFCGAETLRALPVASELLSDLLSFDLVTFSREEDERSFFDAMEYVLGAVVLADKRLKKDNQIVKTSVYRAIEVAEQDVSNAHAMAFGLSPSDKLILSVDAPEWFVNRSFRDRAYELFLNENPTLTRDMVFGSLVTSYAKDESRKQQQIATWMESTEELNDHWRSLSRKPFRTIETDQLSALYGGMAAAKVFVDMSLSCYSSLNLWSFWQTQDLNDPGVLIVSSLIASESTLPGAMIVHPLDVLGLSAAIKEAVLMPLSERKRRYEQLSSVLAPLSSERRCASFVYDVVEQARRNRSQARAIAQRSVLVSH